MELRTDLIRVTLPGNERSWAAQLLILFMILFRIFFLSGARVTAVGLVGPLGK